MRHRFYTYFKQAVKVKKPWQKVRFDTGLGYWLFGKRPKPARTFTEFTMFDSVDLSQIPVNAVAVAGYVNGHWPTYSSLASKFPHARRLSIAVTAAEDADCLDVEKGDADPSQAAAWVKRQIKRGVKRPVVYTSVSQAGVLLLALARGGVTRSQIRLWTAHYTSKPHRCTNVCGFPLDTVADATQYDDRAGGKNLDASLCAPDFL